MKKIGLYVIITDPVVAHEKIVEACVKHTVGMVQLREKRMDDYRKLTIAMNIADIVRGSSTRFIVNDRVDIALASGADGTHVGQDDLPLDSLKKILGFRKCHIVGLSTHSLSQASEGIKRKPHYIGYGPIYPTFAKKKIDAPVGLAHVKEIISRTAIPVVAIGGINRSNVRDVLAAGAQNIAMISAVCRQKNYEEEIRYYSDLLREYDTTT